MNVRRNGPLTKAWSVVVALFLLLPTLIVIPMSFTAGESLAFPPDGLSLRWYQALVDDPEWGEAAWASAQVAFFTVVIATPLGTAAALGLLRVRARVQWAAGAFLLSPMIVPVVVVGVGAFLTLSGWQLAGTMTGLVLVHVVLALPFVVVSVGSTARTLDATLELAAQSLGAGRWATFRRVTLPLITPGVLAGALFAFVTSWDEIVVAIFMTSPDFRTLPVVMWAQVRTELDPSLAAVGTLLVVVSTLALAASQLLVRRTSR